MGLTNLNDIRKLKTELPKSKIDAIQAESDKVIAGSSIYKQNKQKNQDIPFSKPVVKKEVKVEPLEKQHTLRQEFLDSRPVKNENEVRLEEKPEPRVIEKPKPLKYDFSEDKPKEDSDLSFKDFYVREKGKYNKFKFLLLIIFIIFTYLILSFSYKLFLENNNYSHLNHTEEEFASLSDALGNQLLFTDKALVVDELREIVKKLQEGNVDKGQVEYFVNHNILNGVSRDEFIREVDQGQINALISYLVNELLYNEVGIKMKRIIVEGDLASLSAVKNKNDRLILNPKVLDLGLEDIGESLAALIINAVVEDEYAIEDSVIEPHKAIDYDRKFANALTNHLETGDYYQLESLSDFLEAYEKRLNELYNNSTREQFTIVSFNTSKDENVEYDTLTLKLFTKKLYSDLIRFNEEQILLEEDPLTNIFYPTKDDFSYELNLFIDSSTKVAVDNSISIIFNLGFLSYEELNYDFSIVNLSSDEVEIAFDKVSTSNYKVCLLRANERICVDANEDNKYQFPSIKFDSEMEYRFSVDYFISSSDLSSNPFRRNGDFHIGVSTNIKTAKVNNTTNSNETQTPSK